MKKIFDEKELGISILESATDLNKYLQQMDYEIGPEEVQFCCCELMRLRSFINFLDFTISYKLKQREIENEK